MLERRKRRSAKNRTVAYIAAGIVHLGILGALFVNFTDDTDSIEADFAEKVDTIKATTVDESAIKQQEDKLKQKDREQRLKKQREERELKELQSQREQEKKRIEDLQNQQQQEREKTQQLEQQRKAIALKKQQEEEKRRQELAEQKKRDELAAKRRAEQLKKRQEQERLAEQERVRKQEQERIRREEQELLAQQEMNRLLAEEEAIQNARIAQQRATTLRAKYAALIRQKVQPKINLSPDFSRSLTARINVRVTPDGQVRSARTIRSSGNPAYDKAVETAIYAATPLPIPTPQEDPQVHREFQNLNLNFAIADF